MPFKEHGVPLTSGLILQPASKFKATLAGFDTGSRTFKTDHRLLAGALQSLPIGAVDFEFPGMYVSEVDIDEGKNAIDTISVSYLGLIGPKPQAISTSTGSNEFVSAGFLLKETVPNVTLVYVQAAPPDIWAPGRPCDPPIGAGKHRPYALPFYGQGGITAVGPAFDSWILKKRDSRQSGIYWEITDMIEFLIIRGSG